MDNRILVAAAQWGASQAQQTTADAGRVLEWMRTPNRKPANLAFTDGPERQAAYWIEIAQQRVAQQTTEPELPEPEAIRHSFDGYGWMYIDNGHGSGWRSGIDKADAEFMYTAAQMHNHYQAGVRAGAAGSQWQPIDSAPKDGKCLVLVDTDDGVLKSAEVERTNALLRHAYAVIEEAVELIGSDECTAKETLAAIKQHLGGV